MRNVLEIIQRFHHFLLFVILEAIALVLLFSYNGYQRSAYFSSANFVAGGVYEGKSYVSHFFSLSKVNRQLTDRNVQLEAQLAALKSELAEKTKDSSYVKMADLGYPAGFSAIPANVVTNSVTHQNNLITINKGSKDGVKKDMGVMAGTGVVGTVLETSENYSIVLPLLNTYSSLSCTLKNRNCFGFLHWDGGSSRVAYLEDVPRHAKFRLYDQVVTSGYSLVFPPGVPVGKILHVYNSKDGVSYRMQVQLAVDFSTLRNVVVIDNSNYKESKELLRTMTDSLAHRE